MNGDSKARQLHTLPRVKILQIEVRKGGLWESYLLIKDDS